MKKLLLLPLVCFYTHAIGQTIYVRDISTREPVTNAILKDKNGASVTTDQKGKADVTSLDKSDSVSVSHISFKPSKFFIGEKTTSIGITPKVFQLDEVIFSANRTREKKSDVPYVVEVISKKDIEFINQPTTAEVLQNTGAVFVQKSQLGGGSAVLRGFEANKTLMVVDGIRMNNAIYRGGHLQDLITLDANMLDRTEIIFGPASTIYGSDALGGVMHFYTKKPEFSSNDKMLVKANAVARYASVNNENTGHLDFNIGVKNFASITNVTYSKFGDLTSGSTKLNGYFKGWDRPYYSKRTEQMRNIGTAQDPVLEGTGVEIDSMFANENDNLQVGSGYSQMDLMQRFAVKTGEHLSHDLNFQYSESSNINRYDRLTEVSTQSLTPHYKTNKLKFAEWYYGPQKRLLGAYSLNYDGKTFLTDNAKIILAYQKVDQDRISRRFNNNNRTTQMEDVTVLSANVDLMKRFMVKHEVRYGIEFTTNDVNSTANSYNIATNTETTAATRYADGENKMSTFAAYYSYSWEVNDNFVISDGIRFTSTGLRSEFKDTTFFKFPFKTAEQKHSAATGNLGFTWKADNDYKVSFFANTGFRAPNVDDMSKVFESSGSILIVPNPDIKPEYAYNFELNMSKIFQGKYKFDITGFYTLLENALVQRDFTLNGEDSLLYNGVLTKIQAMQNANRAYIYGLTAGVQFDFNDHISFKSILNYTYGRYVDTKLDTVMPLDHIPPLFGQTSLTYKGKNTDVEFFVRYNGKKNTADYSPSGEDNALYSATGISSVGYMPGWFTLNMRLGYSITKNFRVTLACENITDNRYRVFSSGINAPGRNFIVSLRFKM
jgi:hemoglobin/transferrin/lactoferrin receptor protein